MLHEGSAGQIRAELYSLRSLFRLITELRRSVRLRKKKESALNHKSRCVEFSLRWLPQASSKKRLRYNSPFSAHLCLRNMSGAPNDTRRHSTKHQKKRRKKKQMVCVGVCCPGNFIKLITLLIQLAETLILCQTVMLNNSDLEILSEPVWFKPTWNRSSRE